MSEDKVYGLDSINFEQPLVLYGAGIRGRRLLEMYLEAGMTNVFVVDKNKYNYVEGVLGFEVFSLNDIPKNICTSAWFCITIADFDVANEVREELVNRRNFFCLKQEVSYDVLSLFLHSLVYEKMNLKHVDFGESKWKVIFGHYNGLCLGGIESWINNLAGKLKELEQYDVRVVGCKDNQNLDNNITDITDTISINDSEQERGSVARFKEVLFYLKSMFPCILITTHADVFLVAAVILRIHYPGKIKIISTIHGGTTGIINRYMEYDRWTDKVIGCSKDIKRMLIDQGVSENKAYYMTCPFLCEKVLERQYTVNNEDAIRLGWAGRIEDISISDQKRLDVLLECLSYLKNENIIFRMEIAGEGPGINELCKQIRIRGLISTVTLIGRLNSSEIGKFWNRQDICISTSDYEGRSLSILEAMGNGAVPVVTDVSGVGEDIESGWNGYIVPRGDYKAICEKIEYLAEHRELLAVMGQRAHDVVYPKSLLDDHVRFWEKQIEDCIASD